MLRLYLSYRSRPPPASVHIDVERWPRYHFLSDPRSQADQISVTGPCQRRAI